MIFMKCHSYFDDDELILGQGYFVGKKRGSFLVCVGLRKDPDSPNSLGQEGDIYDPSFLKGGRAM